MHKIKKKATYDVVYVDDFAYFCIAKLCYKY